MAAPACSLCGALVPTGFPAASSSSSSESSVKVAVVPLSSGRVKTSSLPRCVLVRAAAKEDEKQDSAELDTNKSTTTTTTQQSSFFTSITDALDFAETRSEKDAELLNDARRATQSGDRMSREQYAALRRKIGGTYRDFFKDSVEVVGDYVEEGWVDKTCRYCKKDTEGAPRTKDSLGRYAHVECAENPPPETGNFFTRLFGR
ncbi:hypothetical protein CY35_17G029900 [Sphagnum magellanicum]|nr:hypothetical protein CY35_17G029900 [Sphagnum magellanicum]